MLSKIPYKITMKKVDGKKRGKENVTARPVARSTKGGLGQGVGQFQFPDPENDVFTLVQSSLFPVLGKADFESKL